MKLRLFSLLVFGCIAQLTTAFAQTSITFEPPTYTIGNFSTETALNNATTPVGFTGQGGWSRSTSTDGGQILATVTSGSYVGGQALSPLTTTGTTYLGAKNLGLTTGFTAYTLTLRQGTTGAAPDIYLGGWADVNNDSLFTQSTESQIMGGIVSGVAGGGLNFGFRGAGFTTRYFSGVAPAAGDYYRLTIGLNFAALTVTMDAFDLTTNTTVDLNGAAAGTQYSQVVTAADFGANPTTYKGVVGRVSDGGTLDNLAVPEPTTCVLLAAAGLVLVAKRRRK